MIKTKRIVIDTNVIVSALIFSNSTTMQAFRGDKDLLVLNPFRDIKIITPNDFLTNFNLD